MILCRSALTALLIVSCVLALLVSTTPLLLKYGGSLLSCVISLSKRLLLVSYGSPESLRFHSLSIASYMCTASDGHNHVLANKKAGVIYIPVSFSFHAIFIISESYGYVSCAILLSQLVYRLNLLCIRSPINIVKSLSCVVIWISLLISLASCAPLFVVLATRNLHSHKKGGALYPVSFRSHGLLRTYTWYSSPVVCTAPDARNPFADKQCCESNRCLCTDPLRPFADQEQRGSLFV